jgi:hypothetical protein
MMVVISGRRFIIPVKKLQRSYLGISLKDQPVLAPIG